MTPEVKLRDLGMASPAVRAILGEPPYTADNPFRWFDDPIPQKIWGPGKTCLRFFRPSTLFGYNQGGLMNLEWPRYQFDILAQFKEDARAAADVFTAFMGTVDLCSSDQFGSPVITPDQSPCFLLNRRESTDYKLQPYAAVVTMDWRVANRTDL